MMVLEMIEIGWLRRSFEGMGRLAEGQRKILETLFGPEAMGFAQVDLKLSDAKVCKNFTCGTCPHDLFSNTRMDLGQCPHTHSTKLKAEYEDSMKTATDPASTAELLHTLQDLLSMRNEYERNIVTFVDDCDRRIRAAQRRLEKTPEENNKTTNLMREIGEIQAAYDAAMAEVETLGSSGRVDESMAELAKAEALKTEKQAKERELQAISENAGASGHQKLRVCDICGAYLSILDSDRRLADHFGGKMHLGYLQLRQTIEEWKNRGPNQQPGRATVSALAPSSNKDRDLSAAEDKKPAVKEDTEMLPPSAPNGNANGSHSRDERHSDRSRDDRHRHSERSERSSRDDRSSREDRYSSRGDERSSRDDRHSSSRDDRYSRSDRDRSSRREESSRDDRRKRHEEDDGESDRNRERRRRKVEDDGFS